MNNNQNEENSHLNNKKLAFLYTPYKKQKTNPRLLNLAQTPERAINLNNPTEDDLIEIFNNRKFTADEYLAIKNYIKENYNLSSTFKKGTFFAENEWDKFLSNLAQNFDYEFSKSNGILFNYGEVGNNFYMILKGKVSVLIPVLITLKLSYFEYLNYLKSLFKFQEIELLFK